MSLFPQHTRKSSAECSSKLRDVGDAIFIIGGKWKLPIIVALSDKPCRFNELQRLVTGISARVLSNELKDMELNGFVRRIVDTRTPVVVEYELTEYSATLSDVLKALSSWGAMHRTRVMTGKIPAV